MPHITETRREDFAHRRQYLIFYYVQFFFYKRKLFYEHKCSYLDFITYAAFNYEFTHRIIRINICVPNASKYNDFFLQN